MVTLRVCESPLEQAQREYDNAKRACAGAEEHCGRDKAVTEAYLWRATSSHVTIRKSALQLNINEPNRMRKKPSTAGSTASPPMFAPTMVSPCTAPPLPVVLITIEKSDTARSSNRPASTRGVRSRREPRQFRGVRRASLPLPMHARQESAEQTLSKLRPKCLISTTCGCRSQAVQRRPLPGEIKDREVRRLIYQSSQYRCLFLAAENFLEV